MRATGMGALLAAVALAGCGGSSKKEEPLADLTGYYPANGEVSGWNRDPANPIQVGVGAAGATALVDGAADPFVALGLLQMATGGYLNTGAGETLSSVRIWQMPDAATAQSIYTGLLSNSLYAANTWAACGTTVGVACRLADTGNSWWLNTRKGDCYVEARISPKSAGSSADALAFLAALVSKIP